MHPKDINIQEFDYNLPDENIATFPLEKRDESKLLIYKNGDILESQYKSLANEIPNNSLLVFNQTKVIFARLLFYKQTGAKIEVFCLEPDSRYPDVQTAMMETGEVYWKCMIGGANKWKEDQKIYLNTEDGLTVEATMMERQEGTFILYLSWNQSDISFAEVLHKAGKIPLPPYLNRDATEQDKVTYQTMFAKEEGSVAAPTAALHFTPNLIEALKSKQIKESFVTLHVGAGTFKPVKAETMEGHDMHAEWIEVSKSLLKDLIQQLEQKQAIIAVGTTSTRTIESLYWIGCKLINGLEIDDVDHIAVPQWLPYEHNFGVTPAIDALEAILNYLKDNNFEKLVTKTQIIIAPGYKFNILDGIVTNFHQPKSTLLLLVSALIGSDWKRVYNYALEHQFRFLSYGDGSLLLNPNSNVIN